MKVVNQNEQGITIRLSWREVNLLRTICFEFRMLFARASWKDERRFCTVVLKNVSDKR